MIVNKNNEGQIWDQLYASYAEELSAFVTARIEPVEAEDLLQEVWSTLATVLQEETILQPRAWLYRVTRNRITDYYRRRNGRPPFLDLTPELDPTEEYTSYPDPDDTWQEIEEALDELPEDQRLVFVRNELGGETLREIAEDLSLPLKTVISRKGYARRRLQVSLQELYEDYFGDD